ncbi:MAG: GAF domain-containing protein [Anaerolineae bacterium]
MTIQDTTPGKGSGWLRQQWERLVSVRAANAEEARLGHIFVTLMAYSIGLMIVLLLFVFVLPALGVVTLPPSLPTALFPIAFLILSLICMVGAKRGRIRFMISLYVWIAYFGVALATLLFNGINSPLWSAFFWVVILAGTLIAPRYAIGMSLGALVLFVLELVLTRMGIYTPLFVVELERTMLNNRIISLIMLLFSGGFLTYLNMQSLRRTLNDLVETRDALETTRRQLENRVQERTAQLRERAESFQSIAEINRVISVASDFSTLLETVVEQTSERLAVEHVGLYLLDETERELILQAASSTAGAERARQGHRRTRDEGSVIGFAAATGRPRLVIATEEDLGALRDPDLPGARSELALPLVARGQLIGVLDLASHRFRAFSEEDLPTLRILADNIAVTLENTRLLEETITALERVERYQEEDVLTAWRRALSRRSIQISYSYDHQRVRAGLPDDSPLPVSPSALESLKMVERDGHYLLLAPVRVQEQTVGVLSFESSRPWTQEERQLAEAVLDQLGLALGNARLLEDTRRSAFRERARSEIVSRVRASVQMDAILRSAAEELGRALQVERTRVQLMPLTQSEE